MNVAMRARPETVRLASGITCGGRGRYLKMRRGTSALSRTKIRAKAVPMPAGKEQTSGSSRYEDKAVHVVDISYGALLAATKHRKGRLPAQGMMPLDEGNDGELELPGHNILGWAIEQAYGPQGLGILTVSGVPRVEELRNKLLPLANKLANLDPEALKNLEDVDSMYSVGWSHGKEMLEGGKPDYLKGSFYANPLVNTPTNDQDLIAQYPSYCRPNIWPTNEIPELEGALMELGALVVDVGQLIGVLCDDYLVARGLRGQKRLSTIIKESKATKARLLHYFASTAAAEEDSDASETGNWCGWHLDHGSLTGLIAGMFIKGDKQVASPDTSAGLYIKDRNGQTTKVGFLPSQIAFQIGQTSQVHSGGELVATPHCVRGAKGENAVGISRNSFAVFMQPFWDEPMDLPAGVQGSSVAQWKEGINFGEFTERTLSNYY